jgi:hypothetical protein
MMSMMTMIMTTTTTTTTTMDGYAAFLRPFSSNLPAAVLSGLDAVAAFVSGSDSDRL